MRNIFFSRIFSVTISFIQYPISKAVFKRQSFIALTVCLSICGMLFQQTAYTQSNQKENEDAAIKFYAPAMKWVKSKLQPGEKIISDTLNDYITNGDYKTAHFDNIAANQNRTVYIFSCKGETNDITFFASNQEATSVQLPDNVLQRIPSATYDIYKISFTGPLSRIYYALFLPHPESLVPSQSLFAMLTDEKEDSVIQIRVITTVKPDPKGYAQNKTVFDQWARDIAADEAATKEERKKNDAAWDEFANFARETINRGTAVYETAKANNRKMYEDQSLNRSQVFDLIEEVHNENMKLRNLMVDNESKLKSLAGKNETYSIFIADAISYSAKIAASDKELSAELSKYEDKPNFDKNKIQSIFFDIQQAALHISNMSY